MSDTLRSVWRGYERAFYSAGMGKRAIHGDRVKGRPRSTLDPAALADELHAQHQQEDHGQWGLCLDCRQECPLAHDGRLAYHRRWQQFGPRGEALRAMTDCPGSGEYPAPIGD